MLESIQTLVDECVQSNRQLQPEARAARDHILEVYEEDMTPADTERFARDMQILWKDPAIQETFAERDAFAFNEPTVSFLERIPEVLNPGYVTTLQDVFLSRVRTSGIVESTFRVASNLVRIVDVGGQRTERKKWIHCFKNVTAVLFVADMTAYNSLLEEDGQTNGMDEALNLFSDVCDCDWFTNSSIILFLNKKDLFRKKVGVVSIRNHFPNFEGVENFQTVSLFIEKQFQARVPAYRNQIYVHLTNATSTSNFIEVFNAIKSHILVSNFSRLGFE
jgi:GTPase SAR1 family protein